jgi:Lrp/AsnC family transcriptional regulator for asnA, asnC and gidA
MRIGFSTWVLFQLQVELHAIEDVAEGLAQLPEVTFVAVTTGAFDILCTAIFRSTDELYHFMTQKLPSFEAIKGSTSSSVLRITKRTFAFGDPRAPTRVRVNTKRRKVQ